MDERTFSTKCIKCRQRAVVLAPIAYSIQCDYENRKYQVSIPDLIVPRCTNCGTFTLHHEATDAIEMAFRKEVGILPPDEIHKHRTALGLSQQQLADSIGVPVESLTLWEEGGQFQPRRYDNALRAFFKVPQLPQAVGTNQSLKPTEAPASAV